MDRIIRSAFKFGACYTWLLFHASILIGTESIFHPEIDWTLSIDVIFKISDQTPLHIATSSSHCKRMLQLLLLHPDVDAHSKNHSGDIPKDIARRQGIYDYLFEISDAAINYIKSPSFTENPFMSE